MGGVSRIDKLVEGLGYDDAVRKRDEPEDIERDFGEAIHDSFGIW